jgi:hypothetical protein
MRLGSAAVRLSFLSLMVVLHASCEIGTPPGRVVRNFLYAANDKDVNAMLRCVDPRMERLFHGAFRIVETVSGVPVKTMLDILPGLAMIVPAGQLDELRFTKVKIVQENRTGRDAAVTVSLNYEQTVRGVRTSSVQTVQFRLRRFENEGWRITGAR